MKYTLKIDLDLKLPEKWLELFIKSRKIMLEGLGFKVEEIVYRESLRGFHFWIRIESEKRLNDMDINLLQFLCNDDVGRVVINAYRIKRGVKNWNKLFSKVIWRKKMSDYQRYKRFLKKMERGKEILLRDIIHGKI